MKTKFRSFREGVSQFLTPQVWKQAHQAWTKAPSASRWSLQPLVWVLLGMALCLGGSEGERFATARAYCVACRQKQRRPGETLQGFQMALKKLPMYVLRALARGLRLQLGESFLDGARIGGFVPFACDGSRLECARAEELQRYLGQSGAADSAPMMYVSALVVVVGQGHGQRARPSAAPAADPTELYTKANGKHHSVSRQARHVDD